ncbi:MAG: ABC transporter permease [Clostridium sp.]
MNMFLHELKAYRKSTIIWTCSLTTFVVLFLSMFPAFSKEVETFKKLMEGFPEPLRKALGLSVDSMSSILGFYAYVFLYITLCGAIQAMNLGTSIISKETSGKTVDFLLSKPVTRSKIMTSKLIAAVTCLVITNATYLVVASVMASIVKTADYSYKIFFMLSITLFFVQLMFLSLGVIISVMASKIKSVIPISLGTVFAFFFIGMLASTTGDGALRYITPFKYFDTSYIIKNSSYDTPFIIIEIAFIIVAITASYFVFAKKDIHAV